MFSYITPYVPTRSRLQAWMVMVEIMALRGMTVLLLAARREDWRILAVWCLGAIVAGLSAGFAAALLSAG